jgi:hypothetical protein
LASHQHLTPAPSLGHSLSPWRPTCGAGHQAMQNNNAQLATRTTVRRRNAVSRSARQFLGVRSGCIMAQIWIVGKASRCISILVTLSTQIPPLVTLTSPRNTHKRRGVRVFLRPKIVSHLRSEAVRVRQMTTQPRERPQQRMSKHACCVR